MARRLPWPGSFSPCGAALGGMNIPTPRPPHNDLGITLQIMGDLASARTNYEQALAIRRKVLGEKDVNTLDSLDRVCVVLESLGEYATARPHCERRHTLLKELQGEGHADTLRALNTLARVFQAIRDFESARRHYEQVLTLRRRTLR